MVGEAYHNGFITGLGELYGDVCDECQDQILDMLPKPGSPLVLSPFVRQNLRRYLSVPNHEDLVVLKELVESGKLTPVIDKTYQLRETPAALGYIEGGHVRGKVVITMSADH